MSIVTSGSKSAGWGINDPVIGLRQWGRRGPHAFPSDVDAIVMGAAEGCALRLQDEVGSVSRQHAVLTRDGALWTLKDLGSKNGSRLDGERRLSFPILAGDVVGIGEIKLVAESHALVELQRFLARILGYGDAQIATIDEAMRGIRDAATRRGVLVLCGAGRLVSPARRIHELALGASRPFVVTKSEQLLDAAQTVAGGTICLEGAPDPSNLKMARETGSSAMFICVADAEDAAESVRNAQRTIVDIPPLAQRGEDREELLLEYTRDAVRTLGAGTSGFREHEMVWLRDAPLPTLEEVEELCMRLVAERVFGRTIGASRVGITPDALTKYLRRRGIPL